MRSSPKSRERFLNLMRQLETSGGTDTRPHRTIESGIQEGDSAVGETALMPNTAKEFANRKRIKGEPLDEHDKAILQGDDASIHELFSQHPEKYQEYNDRVADHVLNNAHGDMSLAATGWKMGHNKKFDSLKSTLAKDPGYQARIDKILSTQQQPITARETQSEQPTFTVPEALQPTPEPSIADLKEKDDRLISGPNFRNLLGSFRRQP